MAKWTMILPLLAALLAPSGSAASGGDPYKEYRKQQKEFYKERRKRAEEYYKERGKREKEYYKERAKRGYYGGYDD